MIERPSPNHNERRGGGPVDILLLHYTGMETAEAALERLCDPAAQASASAYQRFIPRNEMDIAVAGAASWVQLDEKGETIRAARIALPGLHVQFDHFLREIGAGGVVLRAMSAGHAILPLPVPVST